MGHWLQLGHFLGKMWENVGFGREPRFLFGGFWGIWDLGFGIWVRAQGRILVMVVVLEDKESEGEKRVSLGWCWCSF